MRSFPPGWQQEDTNQIENSLATAAKISPANLNSINSSTFVYASTIPKLPCYFEQPMDDSLDKPMPHWEYYFWIELTSQKNGRIHLDGMYGIIEGKSELEGYGKLDKNGLFKFDYEDSRWGGALAR